MQAHTFGLRERYERFHRVTILDESIDATIKLSVRYLPERRLPDKAIDLIDEACSQAVLSAYGSNSLCVSSAQKKSDGIRAGASDVARVLETVTGIDAGKISENDSARIMRMESELHRRVIGQETPSLPCPGLCAATGAGLRDPRRPIGSFLFLGPTGVGKTELSKALSETLFGISNSIIRFDMSEYGEKESSYKMTGAPSGYVGYDNRGSSLKRCAGNRIPSCFLMKLRKRIPVFTTFYCRFLMTVF